MRPTPLGLVRLQGEHPGFKPPCVLRKPTFVSKTVQDYGKRRKWDNKTLDVSTPDKLAAVLNDDEHVLASCWLRLKCALPISPPLPPPSPRAVA